MSVVWTYNWKSDTMDMIRVACATEHEDERDVVLSCIDTSLELMAKKLDVYEYLMRNSELKIEALKGIVELPEG